MTHFVSALSDTQRDKVRAIESLPRDEQKSAAIALLRKTFNVQARHSIINIFDIHFYEGHAAHPLNK